MLHNPAWGPETSPYVGAKSHKMDERNVLNHKDNLCAAPDGAEYLHNSPRNIRAVILPSDSKGQWFESTRAHQLLEIASIYDNVGRLLSSGHSARPGAFQVPNWAQGHPR